MTKTTKLKNLGEPRRGDPSSHISTGSHIFHSKNLLFRLNDPHIFLAKKIRRNNKKLPFATRGGTNEYFALLLNDLIPIFLPYPTLLATKPIDWDDR